MQPILKFVSISAATKAHIQLPQLHNTLKKQISWAQLIWREFSFLVSMAMKVEILPYYTTVRPYRVH